MVSVAVMLVFYLTPVFYKVQIIPERFQLVYGLNPLAQLIQNYRRVFFYGMMPDWKELLVSGFMSIAVLGIGYWVYRRWLNDIYDTL